MQDDYRLDYGVSSACEGDVKGFCANAEVPLQVPNLKNILDQPIMEYSVRTSQSEFGHILSSNEPKVTADSQHFLCCASSYECAM